MLYFPEKIALSGLLVYLFVWLITPVESVFNFSWGALGFIFTCYLFFFFGCLFAKKPQLKLYKPSSSKRLKKAFWASATLGVLGICLRIYDKFFIRGVGLVDSALESREILADSGAGPIAAVAGLMYPFCYIPLIIWGVAKFRFENKLIYPFFGFLIFALPALDALMLLSRSQMLVGFSMLYVAVACSMFKGKPFSRRLIIPALIGFFILISVTVYVFSFRLSEMNLDILDSIINSVYGFTVTPNDWARYTMSTNTFLANAMSATMPIAQYYLHGFFEFSYLWERPDQQIFSTGLLTFDPFVKGVGILGLFKYTPLEFENIFVRVGAYTTFFGPLWVDFAWFGPVFMFLFGLFVKKISFKVRSGNLAAMPLYCYLAIVIFYIPVINFIISATGLYVITVFYLYYLYGNKKLGHYS